MEGSEDYYEYYDACIDKAPTIESLDLLSKQINESTVLKDVEKKRLNRNIDRKKQLTDSKKQLTDSTLRMNGEYFVDAKSLYEISYSSLPKKGILKSFDMICRAETPSYYMSIKQASENKTDKGSLPNPCMSTLGTNSQFIKREKDIFNNNIEPVKAHIFLDSKSCAPGWGHMAEGATGKIKGNFNKEEKNQVRLLRMMGSHAEKQNCLRYDVHNFLSLQLTHRTYFDGEPQLLIIPLFSSLEGIKNWDGKTPYDILILAASAKKTGDDDGACDGKTAAEIYQQILSHFDWAAFDDEKNAESGTCSVAEVREAFSLLGNFVEAMAHSLLEGIPQDLIKLATKRDGVNNGQKTDNKQSKKKQNNQNKKKPPASPMAALAEGEEMDGKSLNSETTQRPDWWPYSNLIDQIKREGGVRLPHLPRKTENIGHVLKLRLNEETGRPLPDPWGLMAKAGCNFSFIEYGYKMLPACKPPVHESQLEYEAALQLHERRARQQEIPSSLIVQVAPLTPTANLGTDSARIETPEGETNESESGWEYFTD
jgi:hypothetical protein